MSNFKFHIWESWLDKSSVCGDKSEDNAVWFDNFLRQKDKVKYVSRFYGSLLEQNTCKHCAKWLAKQKTH